MQSNLCNFYKIRLSKSQTIILIISIIVMTLIVSKLYKSLFQNHSTTTWENADEVVPKLILKKVVTKKSTRYLDISSIKVMQIPSKGVGNLYIFDYGSPQLCGAGGCLYSVYNSDGKTLLEFIANPQPPTAQELVKVSKTVNQRFPCLTITQGTNIDKLLSQTKFCYQQGKYIRLNKNFITKTENE